MNIEKALLGSYQVCNKSGIFLCWFPLLSPRDTCSVEHLYENDDLTCQGSRRLGKIIYVLGIVKTVVLLLFLKFIL